jgi:hypothetical protein
MNTDSVRVLLNFSRDTDVGTYSDSINLSQEEYAAMTADQIEAMKQERVNAWVNLVKNPPPPPPPDPTVRRIDKWTFRQRFTFNEQAAIAAAPLNNDLPIQVRGAVRAILDNLDAAPDVGLDDPDTQAMLQQLVTFGLLTADRVPLILS